jgi:AmpD protein
VKVDTNGWLCGLRKIPSPNCDARPISTPLTLLVIHNISLPPGEFGTHSVSQLFTNQLNPDAHPYFKQLEGLKVSAHFLIRRDGAIIQFVSCNKRAWHAGVSSWQGRAACNNFSLGIELEGSDLVAFDDKQYAALARLIRLLLRHYPTIQHIVGHSDIAPGRKTDPGPYFDWTRCNPE